MCTMIVFVTGTTVFSFGVTDYGESTFRLQGNGQSNLTYSSCVNVNLCLVLTVRNVPNTDHLLRSS